ncbi:MAG: ribosome biogenesis GTPase Der [Mycoplasmatales bacterium]
MSFTVAVIGRPNVGKSTFFNRITESRKAIVENMPGVTRDRLYEKVTYHNKSFRLIDTGGITLENADFNSEIKMQAEIAIDESDLIVFLVDVKSGVTKDDEMIATLLRRANKEVIVVINKVDNQQLINDTYEFYTLGFEHYVNISSVHGSGIYDVLELIEPHIEAEVEVESDLIHFSLIGRPNVGKSSLFNTIINDERSIVSDIEGTTRDAIDTEYEYDEVKYKIIDTAGIKKRGKVYESVDKYSVLRSLKAIEKSDIVLWVVDAERGLVEQDKKVLGYALDEMKPIIIIINKWDLIEKETNTQKMYEEELKAKMPFIADSPMVFLSAKTGKGVMKVFPIINDLFEKYTRKIPTAKLNAVLNEAVMSKTPPSYHKRPVKFYYVTQTGSKPPKFLFFVNNTEIVHFSYKRYLENYFKKAFGLHGIKLSFMFRNKNEEENYQSSDQKKKNN